MSVLVALGSLVLVFLGPDADSSGAGGRIGLEKIAFAQGWVSFRGDEYFEIWTMDPDGSKKRRLTRHGGRDPAWSPDGRRIAYVRFDTAYVMDADGSHEHRLFRGPTARNIASPAWSPDGQKFAFARYMGDFNFEIWVINADGTGQRRLTRNKLVDDAPDWSPDGKRIVFERGNYYTTRAIWVMNADGTAQRRLTRNAQNDRAPDWSSNGRGIVFERKALILSNIWLMNADGSGQRMIGRKPGGDPAWSPDSRRIVFVLAGDVYVMNADGTGERRLTRNKAFDDGANEADDPEWSPVG